MPSPTHSVESPLPLFSFFTPSVYVRKSPAAWKSQAYNRLLTHKQARSPATGLTAGLFLSRFYSSTLATHPLSMSWEKRTLPWAGTGLDHCRSAQALVRVYPPLAAYACLCAQPDIGRLTQASAPLGAMASRSMECCPVQLSTLSPCEQLSRGEPRSLHHFSARDFTSARRLAPRTASHRA